MRCRRTPDIFSYLQQLLDEDAACGRFILTGGQTIFFCKKIYLRVWREGGGVPVFIAFYL